MEEIKTSESTIFTKHSEAKLHKNVDRLVKFDESGSYLAATYHLDKDSQTKSGSIQEIQVVREGQKIDVRGESWELGYGVLSIKREDPELWSVGGSDGKIHTLKIDRNLDGINVEEKTTYHPQHADDKIPQNVCLMHDST